MRRLSVLTTVAACVLASLVVDGAEAKTRNKPAVVHRAVVKHPVIRRPVAPKPLLVNGAPVKADAAASTSEKTPAAETATAAATPGLAPQRLTSALDTTGLGLLETLTTGKDAPANIAVSPLSLASVMALLDLGASPEMRLALHKTLGLTADKADAGADLDALRGLIAPLMASKDGSPLSGASALLFDPASKPFPLAVMGLKAAGAEVSTEKLSDPAALDRINAFISKATNGMIAKILDKAPEGAGLVALNGLYFKDSWLEPFDPSKTQDGAFAMPGKKSVTVPLMVSSPTPKFARMDDKFVAVRLPYGTKGYSLVLVTTKDGAAEVKDFRPALAWLGGEGFEKAQVPVQVTLPRFSLASSSDLLPGLDKLGLRPARLNSKSLSGLAPGPQSIAKVVQKTVIKVDEKGTEAAAATAAVAQRSLELTEIKFDRPFLFALQHEESGLVLMTGYVSDPSKAE